ncbi:hypothetical protein BRADI_1g04903v3 [Brachypodium distachyon]|uniref:UDP-glycosyltransferases domain-containing protein n=1 Tax=Brachypodium distachyon TaxID=15368 RepID=A0A0Q3GQD2_BRADI|nr:hypothetical protein BRADI_1g04903v3 [Brachypodium distachyon]
MISVQLWVQVPCALFQIVLASMVAFTGPRLEDFTVPPKWFPFPSSSPIAYRRHEAGWIAGSFRPNASGVSDFDRFCLINERCRIAVYRTHDELEPQILALLSELFQKPSVSVGILPPPPPLDPGNGNDDEHGVRCDVLRWLDDQPPKSVIYAALGSEAPLTEKNLQELALGLELSGVGFLWALRTSAHGERVQGRGLVWREWVPQVEALAHGATAAFLTHCGWGSTVESFGFGHPLVMLPFTKGIGVEVARDENDGSFQRDGVAAAVRRVMVEDEGKVFARNAKKLQAVLADQGRQERCMDELVELLRRYKDA